VLGVGVGDPGTGVGVLPPPVAGVGSGFGHAPEPPLQLLLFVHSMSVVPVQIETLGEASSCEEVICGFAGGVLQYSEGGQFSKQQALLRLRRRGMNCNVTGFS